jgi:hypothetical protein
VLAGADTNFAKDGVMSPDTAERLYIWASISLLGLSLLTFGASAAVFFSGRVRDRATNLAIATAQASAEESRHETAQANLETARIKARLAWREPTQGQIKGMIDILAGHHFRVVPWYLSGDPEATNLYFILEDALSSAGLEIQTDDVHQLINSGQPKFGVLISGRQPETDLMKRALEAGGLEVTYAGVSDEPLTLWVMTKPRPK